MPGARGPCAAHCFRCSRQYSTHDARNIHSVPEAETLPTTASINRRINDLLLVASPFRSALNAAWTGPEKDGMRIWPDSLTTSSTSRMSWPWPAVI